MDLKRRNRRGFLKSGAALAGGLVVGGVRSASGQTSAPEASSKNIKELSTYGERSRVVTSIRVPVAERMSPDMYGLTFHVLTPLQDSGGIIKPSSLHFVEAHGGSF